MHLVDLLPLLNDPETMGQVIDGSHRIWAEIYDAMAPEDTLWVFAPNARKDSRYWPVAMATADAVRDGSALALKNTITRYRDPEPGGNLSNAYEEILFFVKDKRQYRFDKDRIRVAHVYEGKDWAETARADGAPTTTPKYSATIPTAKIRATSGSKRSVIRRRTKPSTKRDRSPEQRR
jgi:hypothetical protein